MPDINLSLTTEERDELVKVLDRYLSDTRVEVRRTRTPEYHADLQHEEDVLRALLAKLRAAKS